MNCTLVQLKKEADVAIAREEAALIAENMGFDKLRVGQFALAVSEICQNAIRYGSNGEAAISKHNEDRVLRVVVKDEGEGIHDIEESMEEGFSSEKTSLGVGLLAAKRSVDRFEIVSKPGKGTQVLMEIYLPMAKEDFEFGVNSLPDLNHLVNGDEFYVKEFSGDKVMLSVIDGLGQGETASRMAVGVKNVIQENYWLPLKEIILLCDQYLQENSEEDGGVAMSIALLSPGSFEYLGIGDTHAYLIDDSFYPVFNIDGRVGGTQLRSLKLKVRKFEDEIIFILCTDGINTRINPEDLDLEQSPQQIANQIFNIYHRPYGDVTVLVAKYNLQINHA